MNYSLEAEPAQEHIRNALSIIVTTGMPHERETTTLCFDIQDIDRVKSRLKEAIRLLEEPRGKT